MQYIYSCCGVNLLLHMGRFDSCSRVQQYLQMQKQSLHFFQNVFQIKNNLKDVIYRPNIQLNTQWYNKCLCNIRNLWWKQNLTNRNTPKQLILEKPLSFKFGHTNKYYSLNYFITYMYMNGWPANTPELQRKQI